ncbi:MAG: phosphoglucosamine mutase, partial [Oscillospiraceae bacterium]|nr:phosphoglucosamine mutase [Oscillospiraceae bacterium]
ADAGIMISASHNPAEYNGIKIFSGEGYKIPDEYEAEIEDFVLNKKDAPLKTGAEVGRITFCNNAQNDYAEYILSTTEVGDRSLKILIDCANGSATTTAEKIFGKLSSYCTFIGNTPDGTNINDGCGSLHIERLKQQVLDGGFDLAVAFDGDADRIMALDEKGNIIDGDKLMAIFANYYKEKNELDNDTLVATVMSNFGLFKFAEKLGIVCKKTKVGDRFVLEEMLKSGDVLGGEQSGHIILKKYATTGDGELSAVKLIEVLNRAHKPLSELASVMDTYPQVLINVTVSNDAKSRYETDEIIKKSVMENEKRLEGDGRVLVRASGTEPLIRVMAEGLDKDLVKDCAEKIAQVIKERLS